MDLAGRPSPTLVDILRLTLLSLGQSRDFSADDPAPEEFKRSILRLIADLQRRKAGKPKAPENRPQGTSRSVLTLIVKPGRELDPEQS